MDWEAHAGKKVARCQGLSHPTNLKLLRKSQFHITSTQAVLSFQETKLSSQFNNNNKKKEFFMYFFYCWLAGPFQKPQRTGKNETAGTEPGLTKPKLQETKYGCLNRSLRIQTLANEFA